MSNVKTTETVINSGLGLGTLTFLVLMVLKVLGLIEMNWFWVLTSMLWVPVLTFCAVMLLMAGFFLLFVIVAYAWGKLFGSGG